MVKVSIWGIILPATFLACGLMRHWAADHTELRDKKERCVQNSKEVQTDYRGPGYSPASSPPSSPRFTRITREGIPDAEREDPDGPIVIIHPLDEDSANGD